MSMTENINKWGLSEQRIDELQTLLKVFERAEDSNDLLLYLILLTIVMIIAIVFIGYHVTPVLLRHPDIDIHQLFTKLNTPKVRLNVVLLLGVLCCFYTCSLFILGLPISAFNPHPENCNDPVIKHIKGIYLSSYYIQHIPGETIKYVYIYEENKNEFIKLAVKTSHTRKHGLRVRSTKEQFIATPLSNDVDYSVERYQYIGTPIEASYYSYSSATPYLKALHEYYKRNYIVDISFDGVQAFSCDDYQSWLKKTNERKNEIYFDAFVMCLFVCFFFIVLVNFQL